MKKYFVSFAFAAAVLAAPVASFAQSNVPLTRAQVRADLVRVEQAGYNPSLGDDVNYPADIQAAEAKIAAENAAAAQTNDSFGGVAQNGTSSMGTPQRAPMNPGCTGPVSYCNIYFGS